MKAQRKRPASPKKKMDLETLAALVSEGFEETNRRFDEMQGQMDSMQGQINDILVEIRDMRAEIRDLNERVTRLEEAVRGQAGFAKDIDYALQQIRSLERRLDALEKRK